MADAPQLGQIEYSTVANSITANWTSESGTMFRLSLFQDYGTTPILSSDWPGGFGMLNNPPLNTTSVFTVAVAELTGTTPGPYSNPVEVVVGPPRDVQLDYDGDVLALSWKVPAGATVATGAQLTLRTGTTIVRNIGVDGTRTIWRLDTPLDPTLAYTVTVAGTVSESFGPSSPEILVIQAAPVLAQLLYTTFEGSTAVTANNSATPPVATPPVELEAELRAGDELVATATGSTALVAISLEQPLGPWSLYTVRLAFITTGSRGPWSNTLPVLVQPASITRSDYDGTKVTAAWDWVAGEPAPAGATISILKSDGSTLASAAATGTSLQFTPDPQPTANTPYTLTALATRGSSMGTVSAAVPLLTYNIAPLTATYDGAGVGVTWTNTTLTGVTKLQLHLRTGGQTVQSQIVSGGSATMAVQLPANAEYSVALQTLGDLGSGPLGTALAVIACVPEITATKYTANGANSKVHVEWTAAGQTTYGVASWSVQLWRDGVAWQTPVTVAAGTYAADVSPGSALDALKTYTATVRGINGTAQSGPLSAPAPVLAVASPPLSAAYDGANVAVAWAGAGDDALYSVKLTDKDGASVTSLVTGSTSAVLALASASNPAYHAVVKPFRGQAEGTEASLDLLTAGAAAGTTAYDGAVLHVTWGALAGATSYLVQLRDGNGVILEQPAAGTDADIAAVLAPSGDYSVAVRGVGASVVGPPGTTKPVLPGPPAIETITATTAAVTVTWSAAPGGTNVTGYTASLESPGIPAVTATGTASATLQPASLDAWRAYTVRVQPAGNGLTGPSTAPARVLVAAPAVRSLTFDGAQVLAQWDALSDPAVTAYTAQIVDGSGANVGNAVTTTATSAALPLTPQTGKTYSVVVSAVGGLATGPTSVAANAPVILAKPALSSVAYDGTFVTVTFGAVADTNVTGYVARLLQDGVLLAAETVSGRTATTIRIAASLSAGGSYDVSVAATGAVSEGEESTSVAAIAAVPRVTGSTVTSSKVTVTWNAAELASPHGVGGYSVQLWRNGATSGNAVSVSGATTATADITLAAALDPWARYAVTVQATGAISTGAASDAAGVIASIPAILSASITGFGWSLSWTAATEELVTGYRVTVTDAQGGHPQTFDTTHTALALPNTFANGQSQATVQAVGATATGQSSAAANLYGPGSAYYFSPTGGSASAYTFRAATQPPGPSTITLYLPDLFNGTPNIQNDIFVLTKPATSASYPYLITIAQNSDAWQFTPSARSALWNAYIQFLKDLDVVVNGEPQLKPGAFQLITQVLGRALPLLFEEQLGYLYRFVAANGTIDLVPGMRLRIDSEARQYSGPPSTSNVNINGFVSSGTSVFDLGQYWQGSQLNTGFNSYLSLTGRPAVPETNTTGGAAGGLDFYPALNRLPLFRLIYPAAFPATNGFGYADLTDNIVIIGANYFGDLQNATNQYISNGNFIGFESKIFQTWFRGRAVLLPEIPILVNGALQYVAVGTTVRQLLGIFGGGAYPAGSYAGGLTIRRAINNVVDSVATAVPPEAVRTNEVRIADLPLSAYSGGVDALDLPVIQGDSFTFGAA